MALAQQKLDSSTLETTVQLPEQPYQPSPPLHLQTEPADSSGMEEIDYESLPTEKLSTHLVAGAAAGMMEHCAMYPVDCVKVMCAIVLCSHCCAWIRLCVRICV